MNSPRSLLLATALILGLFPVRSPAANLLGSDDFDDNLVDPLKWGPDFNPEPHGVFTETNGRLEYTQAAGIGLGVHPWILNEASYDADWEAQLDVHVGNVALSTNQDILVGLAVLSGSYLAAINLEYEDVAGTLLRGFHAVDDGPAPVEIFQATTSLDAAVRLSFSASDKVLSWFYDEDAAVGGYNWTFLHSSDLDAGATSWGLTSGATFSAAIFAESNGPVIVSGDAYADKFQAVPEPGMGALLAVGSGMMLGRRRRPSRGGS